MPPQLGQQMPLIAHGAAIHGLVGIELGETARAICCSVTSATACRPSGLNRSINSNPSACIAFTISRPWITVAARCDMGDSSCVPGMPQLEEYPFLPLTQKPIRQRFGNAIDSKA